MDDERLKHEGASSIYFEKLLQKIRDIRSSERNFYQKATDIYATSIDYKKDDTLTNNFFAAVQNKMYYAIHGHLKSNTKYLSAIKTLYLSYLVPLHAH